MMHCQNIAAPPQKKKKADRFSIHSGDTWGSPGPAQEMGAAESVQSGGGVPTRAQPGTGSDSHIHQLGRLVHPHGEAVLALRGHQQLLHRGAHGLHPGAGERGSAPGRPPGARAPVWPGRPQATYFCAALSHATSSSRVMLQL